MIARTTIVVPSGQGPGQVRTPRAIAVDRNTGNIFVADMGNDRIQKFSPTFTFIKEWGGTGTGNGKFNTCTGIALDSNGNVYVADARNDRIQKFDNNGVFIDAWGQHGTGDGEFILPQDVAVESDDDIVVTDGGNSRVQKFKSNSEFIRKWGKTGDEDGEFIAPIGIAVDPNDDIYVAENHRVQKFNLNGVFIKKWGGGGQFEDVRNITYNPLTTNLLVSDKKNGIQIFTRDGGFVGKVDFGPILRDQ
jgi:DNA-binding beta-propeller fold protein YncE